MSDLPVDLLGGGDGPPPSPFGKTESSTTRADATANGSAAAAGAEDADDGYSFAPPPSDMPVQPASGSVSDNNTGSTDTPRGFGRIGTGLGGALGGLGRSIKTATATATTAVSKTSERIDSVGSRERKGPMMNVAMQRTLSGVSGTARSSPKSTPSKKPASAPNSGSGSTGGTGGGFSLGSSLASLTTSVADGLSSTTSALSQSITTNLARQYTMPDRTVASQVLMYRQLLHTECKPGLRLSRAFQGTPAQRAVMHMPWWEQGVETSKRMVISYDNLIVRLWLSGAIMPYVDGGYAHDATIATNSSSIARTASDVSESSTGSGRHHVDSLIDSKGLPPIPHEYWVERLGFQQTDPVTDFRSGGVLSLAMLVHVVEACPQVHARFLPSGPAHMLPFGITCINITDMLAKFLMFSKSVDRIDALLSQKPFWKMFGDPNSLLVCQELAMDMLADVVVELVRERNLPRGNNDMDLKQSLHGEDQGKVTVFDFAEILDTTERRVRDDLLGAGPKTVEELRAVHGRIKVRYERAMAKKEREAERKFGKKDAGSDAEKSGNSIAAGAGALLDKISREKAAGEEEDVPTKTVSAIEEVAFGDSHDEMDATTANGTAVDLLAGDNPAPAAIATPVSTPAAADALDESASVVESSPAVAAEAATASASVDAPEPATGPITAEAAAILAEPDLLSGANPNLSQEEADFLGALDDFDIGDGDLDDGGILDFLDNAATK